VYSPQTGVNASPRIGALAIVSPVDLAGCAGCEVTVRNIVGFFVDRPAQGAGADQQVWGRLVKVAGRHVEDAPTVDRRAAAVRHALLVR
jgi:hypothetical protein